MSIVTKIGSRGVPEPKHLSRILGVCGRELEEVGGEGGEVEREGEGVDEGVGGRHGRPGGVEAPELGCNFVEGLRREVWLGGWEGGACKGWVGRPAVQTKGTA